MAETMEEYMSKTRADYGSGVTRPKIDDKDHFELKGQFLKNKRHLQRKYCPLARTAKKMEEINSFQQEPDETLYQALERFKELFMKFPQHYLTETREVILFYNRLEVPTRQILDSKGAIPTKTTANAKIGCKFEAQLNNLEESQEGEMKRLSPARSSKFGILPKILMQTSYQGLKILMEESLSKFMSESEKRHAENSNLIMEIRASTNAAFKN
ncbi:hypothetical protein Tco_0989530 [Tanacetum coccineum]|uniref:Retrotransposon gag domain-containing protein n=1 Tax=Tanacetum coccineum TaxID=301880 RepID=A0ABQ5ETY8_9ASTR